MIFIRYIHESYAQGEALFKQIMEEEHTKRHAVHAKTRGDIIVKYFSDCVSPQLHDSAAKKEAFGKLNPSIMI
jgi:hypothetical protein